jgi:UDP-N-acetylglucosamine--N-acetylmuramyl-(pentapeptide) pyrophosphoryl-undecaprenol N-acetylglucosamine transferase
MAKSELRIALTGGGSGGHIYPLLAVAEAVRNISQQKHVYAEMRYFGPNEARARVLESAGVTMSGIAGGKIRRYASILNVLDVPKFFIGMAQAFWKLFFFMPDVVFSKGGPGAFSVAFAAWFYRIPVIIHESDAEPGLGNLLSAPLATRIAVTFDHALPYFKASKAACVGTPMRSAMIVNPPAEETAKESLGFKPDQPLVLVLGGSQGSQRINKTIIFMLKQLMEFTQVLHQAGPKNFNEVKKLSQAVKIDVPAATELSHRYEAVPYLEETMQSAFAAADLIVARAGSGTISEIAFFKKPSILVPLDGAANDHQNANAHEFAKAGAAIVVEEENLAQGILLQQIRDTLKNAELRKKMSEAAGKFFKPQAAELIAEEIFLLAGIH